LTDKTDGSHPATDDDLAPLSTILGREPLNIPPQFPGRRLAIFFGFINTIASCVVVAYPFDSIETLARVVGAWLIILRVRLRIRYPR
jgi:hypothetical protein